MDIKDTFIKLTRQVVPEDKELLLLSDLLPSYLEKDPVGNLFFKVGDSDTMFTSHLDTVGSEVKKINHVIDNGFIRSDGYTILGADDKTGVVIMLYMIEHQVPGYYFFFMGEENGCIGSGKFSKWLISKKGEHDFKDIKKVIAFDRMGYDSVITHMGDQRCCSDTFADDLANKLNSLVDGFIYKKDPTGSYTDSGEFADIFPECTNLSVGYFNQHNYNEVQDMEFLESLCEACIKLDWSSLPVERDPSSVEFIDSYYGTEEDTSKSKNYIRDHADDYSKSLHSVDPSKIQIDYFYDKKHKYISDVSFLRDTDIIVDINISPERVTEEADLIEDMLIREDVIYDTFYWDGLILAIEEDRQDTKMTRNELIEYLPELELSKIEGFVDYKKLKEKKQKKEGI